MDSINIEKITNYIFLESKPQKADLVIVFGTRHKVAVEKVYWLYKNKLVSKILVSGGMNMITGENEAHKMSNSLIDMGVLKRDIILEDRSTNTLENIIFSKKIIEEKIGFNNLNKIITVTKHYHSRRVLMTIRKHFPRNITIIPVTYEIYGFTKDNWSKSEMGNKKVLGEYERIKEYLKRGDIEKL